MKHQLELRHFAALVALADQGTVGKASRSLGMAQSTLSETLLSLDRALGAPVLERSPGSAARLTDVATRLLPHARSILQAVERAQAEALLAPARLDVGTTESLSALVLPFVLSAFHRAHPDVDVQVSTDLCESLHRRLASGELGLIVTMEPTAPAADWSAGDTTKLEQREIGRVPLVLLGGAPAAVDRARLSRAPLYMPDPGGALHAVARHWARALGVKPRLLSVGTVDAVRRSLAAVDGLSILPRYAVVDDLRRGTLHQLDPPLVLPEMAVLASVRAGDSWRRPVVALCELIGERLDQLLTAPVVARTPRRKEVRT